MASPFAVVADVAIPSYEAADPVDAFLASLAFPDESSEADPSLKVAAVEEAGRLAAGWPGRTRLRWGS